MSSAKWQPFCLNVLIDTMHGMQVFENLGAITSGGGQTIEGDN